LIDFTQCSDDELQSLYLHGNEEAGSELAIRYRRLVKVCIRPYFLVGGDSEDLLQEGMIGLLSAIRNFDPNGDCSFKTFAELCVKRRVISAAKASTRLKHTPLNDGISLDELLSGEADGTANPILFSRSPEDQLLAQETKQDFLSTYSKLLSGFELQILSCYLSGQSYREIAENCKVAEKSVDNAVQRIRKKLARHIDFGEFST